MFNEWEIAKVAEVIVDNACKEGRDWFHQHRYYQSWEEMIAEAPKAYLNWLMAHLPRFIGHSANIEVLVAALYERWPHVAWTWERWAGNPDIFFISYVVRGTGHTSTRILNHIGRAEVAEFIRIVLDWRKS